MNRQIRQNFVLYSSTQVKRKLSDYTTNKVGTDNFMIYVSTV